MRMRSLTVNPSYEFIKESFTSYATGGYGLYNRHLLLAATGLIPAVATNSASLCWSVPQTVSGDLSPYKGGYNVGGGVAFGATNKFSLRSVTTICSRQGCHGGHSADVRYSMVRAPANSPDLLTLMKFVLPERKGSLQ
jgi:hypothetical protein